MNNWVSRLHNVLQALIGILAVVSAFTFAMAASSLEGMGTGVILVFVAWAVIAVIVFMVFGALNWLLYG